MPWPPPLLWPSLCTHSPILSTLYLYHLLSLLGPLLLVFTAPYVPLSPQDLLL